MPGVPPLGKHSPGHRVERVWVGVSMNSRGDEMPTNMWMPQLGQSMPMFTTEERIARDIFPELAKRIGAMNNEEVEVREFRRVDS